MFDIYFLDNLCSVVTQVVENAKAADEVSFFSVSYNNSKKEILF